MTRASDFAMKTESQKGWKRVSVSSERLAIQPELLYQQSSQSQSLEEEKHFMIKKKKLKKFLSTNQLYRRHYKENFNLKRRLTIHMRTEAILITEQLIKGMGAKPHNTTTK